MLKVDEPDVLKRAKKLCKQDGFVWDLEAQPSPKYTKIALPPVLKEDERRNYLARAREELLKELCNSVD